MKRMVALASAYFILHTASGQVPQLINYQGRLLDGTNLLNGTFGIELRLYNVATNGSSIYKDSNQVVVVDGLYSTFIGDNPTSDSFLNALTNTAVYVEVAVNGLTLSPRERLASVGYSLATYGLLLTTNKIVVLNPTENFVDVSARHSTIGGGGLNNIHSGALHSVIGGGFDNLVDGAADGTIGGGEQNSIFQNADWSSIGGGFQCVVNSNSHSSVIAGGFKNIIGPDAVGASIGGGLGAKALHYGEMARASGFFNEEGDAQVSEYVLRNTTVGPVTNTLFMDVSSRRLTVSPNQAMALDIMVVASSPIGSLIATYQLHTDAQRFGGNNVYVNGNIVDSTPTDIPPIREDHPAWSATVGPNQANRSVDIHVSGESNVTIRWVAHVRAVSVTFP